MAEYVIEKLMSNSSNLHRDTKKDITKVFRETVNTTAELAVPVATIKALIHCLEDSEAKTMTEFTFELENLTKTLLEFSHYGISILAGCELFTRFATRMASDEMNFEEYRQLLLDRGKLFVEKSHLCREKISDVGLQFIQDGMNIMIHSCSKVVMILLQKAAKLNKRFKVYVTEARPACQGIKAIKILEDCSIPCQMLLDAAVGYYIEKMDMILVGAEGVVENGGLINQIGTYQMSIMAKAANIPFYAMAESYKFVRLFPLNQYDLPTVFSSSSELMSSITPDRSTDKKSTTTRNVELCKDHPLVDYTPPSGITLLFTDLGVLTPSGVSDELIKFYY